MPWGHSRRTAGYAFALIAAACGGSEAVGQANGGYAGSSGCQDYVTADGYTCCCEQSFCTRTPGCRRDDVVSVPPKPSDAGTTPDGAGAVPYPAPHAPLPEVTSSGGPVLRAPRAVPVFFRGDDLEPQIEAFMAVLPGSTYWATATQEYGVAGISVAKSVVAAEAAPSSMTDSDVDTWLGTHIDGQSAGFPPATDGDIYVLILPESTTITTSLGRSCQDFDGYHIDAVRRVLVYDSPDAGDSGTAARDGGTADAGVPSPAFKRFVYAVINRCPEQRGRSQFDELTTTISHELIEASTDPFARSHPAYVVVDPQYVAWERGITTNALSELADLCIYDGDPAFFGQYAVQRSWSNRAAVAGLDPCVPSGRTPYYAAAVDVPEQVVFEGSSVFGVSVPVGTSRTVDVRLLSTSPVPDWSVSAAEGPMLAPGNTLSFAWNREVGNNGDVLKLTITRLADGPLGGASVLLLFSSPVGQSASGFVSAWPVFVTN